MLPGNSFHVTLFLQLLQLMVDVRVDVCCCVTDMTIAM